LIAARTLKERVRAVWNILPNKLIEMVIGLSYYACKMINKHVSKATSTKGLAPKEIFRLSSASDALMLCTFLVLYLPEKRRRL